MNLSKVLLATTFAASIALFAVPASALKLSFDTSSTSTNDTAIPVSGEAVFSFTDVDVKTFGGNLRIDVDVTNTTQTTTSITQSFLVGFGFDIIGKFEKATVGTKLDNVVESASFPGNITVDTGACVDDDCTGGGKPEGISNGLTDSFIVYTSTTLNAASAEGEYFKLFNDGQPFSTGGDNPPTSVMRWRGIEGADSGGGSETKFNPVVVPLPAAAWLLIAAFGGLGVASRIKKKHSMI